MTITGHPRTPHPEATRRTVHPAWSALVVHVPLAMLLLGLAVWLPMAARRR